MRQRSIATAKSAEMVHDASLMHPTRPYPHYGLGWLSAADRNDIAKIVQGAPKRAVPLRIEQHCPIRNMQADENPPFGIRTQLLPEPRSLIPCRCPRRRRVNAAGFARPAGSATANRARSGDANPNACVTAAS